MAMDMNLRKVRSNRTTPSRSRRCGLEHLEPRTVLSATQIVVITLGVGVSSGSARVPVAPDMLLSESVLVTSFGQLSRTPHVLPHSHYATPPAWTKGPRDPVGQMRPQFAPGKVVLSPIVAWPASTVRGSLQVDNDRPEGEASVPDRSVPILPVSYREPVQAIRGTDPISVGSQLRSQAADDVVFGADSWRAIGGWSSTTTGSSWELDTSVDRHWTAQDLLYGLRDSGNALVGSSADLPVGDVTQAITLDPGTGGEASAATWWIDDLLSDVLQPLEKIQEDSLPGTEEGVLAGMGTAVETHLLSAGQPADPRLTKRERDADRKVPVAHDRSWPDQRPNWQEPSPGVDPRATPEVVDRAAIPPSRTANQPAISGSDEEGGMVTSLAGPDLAHDANCPQLGLSGATGSALSLESTEVRLDAAVGFYQAFDVSTEPHTTGGQSGVSDVESQPGRDEVAGGHQIVNE